MGINIRETATELNKPYFWNRSYLKPSFYSTLYFVNFYDPVDVDFSISFGSVHK